MLFLIIYYIGSFRSLLAIWLQVG